MNEKYLYVNFDHKCLRYRRSPEKYYDFSVNLTSESGKIVSYYRPWFDDFESLDSLEMRQFVVSGSSYSYYGDDD